jgi:hypothetical protein
MSGQAAMTNSRVSNESYQKENHSSNQADFEIKFRRFDLEGVHL